MAKREARVSEDRLETLVANWNTKDVRELAEMLGTRESTINDWAKKLRRSMKSNGMTDEQVKKILPAKRKVHGDVYDIVAKKMLSPEQAPTKRGRKPK